MSDNDKQCDNCQYDFLYANDPQWCPVCGLHTTHNGFRVAWQKGSDAFDSGGECPYEDKRGGKFQHVTTWSRTFIRAWCAGYVWRQGSQGIEKALGVTGE